MSHVLIDGLYWPAADTRARPFILASVHELGAVYQHVADWRVCVQAGGNTGVWPKELARRFGVVYTFEPDPDNFDCLVRNCPEANIVKLQAAVGWPRPPTNLAGPKSNCGAFQTAGYGDFPVLGIDALMLPVCGLLCLDIEGDEPLALRGAAETIKRCRPTIVLENKGHAQRHGCSAEDLDGMVEKMGYRVAERVGRDVVYVPNG